MPLYKKKLIFDIILFSMCFFILLILSSYKKMGEDFIENNKKIHDEEIVNYKYVSNKGETIYVFRKL